MDEITSFELLTFGHVAAAVAWVGGGAYIQMLVLRSRGVGPDRLVQLLGDVAWSSNRYFIPVSLLTIALGFALVADSNGAYDLGQLWITLALGAYVVTFLTGALFLGPESGRIAGLAEERGSEDEEVQRRLTRLFWVSRLDLLLLFLVIFDMVVKPGL